jgi:hypothetical protein
MCPCARIPAAVVCDFRTTIAENSLAENEINGTVMNGVDQGEVRIQQYSDSSECDVILSSYPTTVEP